MPWNTGLKGTHYDIAKYAGSPLRVRAGPGTGKTFALMRRVARLLEKGVKPKKMLALTFTRTAAKDLVDKLQALGAPGAAMVNARTLHSLCFSLLNRNAVFGFTGRTARPLVSHEIDMLVCDLARSFGGKRKAKKRIAAFEAYWATLQSQDPGWPSDPVDQAFDLVLKKWLRFHEAMILGELVILALDFIQKNPSSKSVPRYSHVLVDEYQDLNRADQVLVDELAEHGKVMVIGDEDQSIYRFRFAHPEGITEYPSTHAGTHDEILDECRRCPKKVVSMASTLVAHNRRPSPNTIRAMSTNPDGDIHVVQHDTLDDEIACLADFVCWQTGTVGVSPGELIVLVTRRKIGIALRDVLNERASQEGLSWTARSFFFEECIRKESAKRGLVFLQLLVTPEDRPALRCWLGLGAADGRAKAYAKLMERCEALDLSPSALLQAMSAGTEKKLVGLHRRYELLRGELTSAGKLSGQELVDFLFPDGDPDCGDVRAMAVLVAEDAGEPEEILEGLKDAITQPELPGEQDDVVRVMSLHKCKGLTARVVVVAGCVAGGLPTVDRKAPKTEQHLQWEEQRRLFYVAITRTTETLVLSSAAEMPFGEAMQMGLMVRNQPYGNSRLIASPFFSELGPECPDTETGDDWRDEMGF